jgi:hypothetical protein
MYPTSKKDVQTTPVMGGRELSTQSSKSKDLAWELITSMLELFNQSSHNKISIHLDLLP